MEEQSDEEGKFSQSSAIWHGPTWIFLCCTKLYNAANSVRMAKSPLSFSSSSTWLSASHLFIFAIASISGYKVSPALRYGFQIDHSRRNSR